MKKRTKALYKHGLCFDCASAKPDSQSAGKSDKCESASAEMSLLQKEIKVENGIDEWVKICSYIDGDNRSEYNNAVYKNTINGKIRIRSSLNSGIGTRYYEKEYYSIEDVIDLFRHVQEYSPPHYMKYNDFSLQSYFSNHAHSEKTPDLPDKKTDSPKVESAEVNFPYRLFQYNIMGGATAWHMKNRAG